MTAALTNVRRSAGGLPHSLQSNIVAMNFSSAQGLRPNWGARSRTISITITITIVCVKKKIR